MRSARYTQWVSYGLLAVAVGCTALARDYEQPQVSPDQVRRQQTQEELAARRQIEQWDQARQTAQQLHARALKAQELLASLKQRTDSFFARMETLLDSDAGKRLARDPIGVQLYKGLRDYPSVSRVEIAERVDLASALVNRLTLIQSGPEIGIVPNQETQDQVNELFFWVQDRSKAIERDTSRLDDIVRQAPGDFDVAKAKTLRVVLDEMDAQFYAMLVEYRMQGAEKAVPAVKEMVIDAAYLRQMERARAEEEVRRKEVEAQILKIKTDSETAMLRQKAEADRKLFEAQKKYDDALAELERLRKDAEVARQVADNDATLARDAQLDESERKRKIALAQSTEVKTMLAPFLAHGYWQPGSSMPSYTKGPISLSKLRAQGALQPSSAGLDRLIRVACDHHDKERPRWGVYTGLANLSALELDQIRQAQQYLIDLADVMVDLGMLAP